MPQHLGFRDRLPENFGSENLRENIVLFDDLLSDTPEQGPLNLQSNSGLSNGLVQSVPGGVYSLGIGNLGVGQGITVYSSRCWNASKQLNFGARVIFTEEFESTLGYNNDQMGFFAGMHGVEGNVQNLFALFGYPILDWGFGFLRDAVTVVDPEASFLQAAYWWKNTKTSVVTVVRENLSADFSAGWSLDTWYTLGLTTSNAGVVRFNVDGELVHEMKPVLRSDGIYGPMVAHFKAGDSGVVYPTPAALDWIYCAQARGDNRKLV